MTNSFTGGFALLHLLAYVAICPTQISVTANVHDFDGMFHL